MCRWTFLMFSLNLRILKSTLKIRDMSNNSGNVALAALIGAAVGVGIGILVAPDSGANTRKKIKDQLSNSKEQWLNKWNALLETAGNKSEDLLSGLDALLDEWLSDEKKNDSDALIALLEKKLEVLKQQSKKA